MASVLTNNLYPPIVDTYMPAFVEGEDSSCQIIFTLSNYNDISDILQEKIKEDDIDYFNVQVTVKDQLTNQNVLSSTYYPAGVMLSKLKETSDGSKEYYITIRNNDIEGGFKANHFYKVQLRLISAEILKAAEDPSYKSLGNGTDSDSYIQIDQTGQSDYEYYKELKDAADQAFRNTNDIIYKILSYKYEALMEASLNSAYVFKIASWLANNVDYFSEWSTVCLIKCITEPIVVLNGFNESDNRTAAFSSNVIEMAGYIDFGETVKEQNNESEVLKQYKFILRKGSDMNTVIEDSGWIYPTSITENKLSYTFYHQVDYDVEYNIELIYVTRNLYTGNIDYNFAATERDIFNLESTVLTAAVDEQDGFIELKVKSSSPFLGNLVLRRSDSTTDFTIWEDINIFNISHYRELNERWRDFTVQSGIWYKYLIQRKTTTGRRGSPIYLSIYKPYTTTVEVDGFKTDKNVMVMGEFDDFYLTADGEQLKVRLQPNISNFKVNVGDVKSDTLGSKYPYFKRNGNMYYKSFTITGMIHSYMDDNSIFLNRDDALGQWVDDYDAYNENHSRFRPDYDYVYEARFKEKVIEFLYRNNVKLYRSAQEGNILVKLMDISFTPNQTVNGVIYDFTATAYEVDTASISNYLKYNILNFGAFDTGVSESYRKLGQFFRHPFAGIRDEFGNYRDALDVDNVVELVQERWLDHAPKSYQYIIDKLIWMRIEFNSAPALYYQKTVDQSSVEDGLFVTKLIPVSKTDSVVDKYFVEVTELKDPEQEYEPGEEPETVIKRYPVVSGYVVTINDQDVFVSAQHKFYELTGTNIIDIYSVTFPIDVNATIDYIAEISLREDLTRQINVAYFQKVIGQLSYVFPLNKSIIKQIKDRYIIKKDRNYRFISNIYGIAFSVTPFASVMIKDTLNVTPPTDADEKSDYERHIIGYDGYLRLVNTQGQIEDAYFDGIYMRNATNLYFSDHNIIYEAKDDEYIDFTKYEDDLLSGSLLDAVSLMNIQRDYMYLSIHGQNGGVYGPASDNLLTVSPVWENVYDYHYNGDVDNYNEDNWEKNFANSITWPEGTQANVADILTEPLSSNKELIKKESYILFDDETDDKFDKEYYKNQYPTEDFSSVQKELLFKQLYENKNNTSLVLIDAHFKPVNNGVYVIARRSLSTILNGWNPSAQIADIGIDPEGGTIFQDVDPTTWGLNSEERKINDKASYLIKTSAVDEREYDYIHFDPSNPDADPETGDVNEGPFNQYGTNEIYILVLTVGEELSIYHNLEWYPFEKIDPENEKTDGLMKKTITGYIDYFGMLEEGVYEES